MPELGELLKDAAGTPHAPDLRGAMARRRRRRNRRRVVIGAVVVLGAVVGVALAVDEPAPVRTITRPLVDSIPIEGRIQGIVDDGANLWVGVQQHRRRRVDWFDDVTGEQRGSVPIDHPIEEVVLGGDHVWVAGRNPLDEMRGGISRIDRRTGLVERVLEWPARSTGLMGGIDLAWDGWALWASDGHAEIDRIPTVGDPVRMPLEVQPRSIATASTGTWVELADGTLGLVDQVSGALSDRARWGGRLFASSGDGVWTTEDGLRAVELFPENLGVGVSVALGRRTAGSRPVEDVVPTADGAWVTRSTDSELWTDGARPARVVHLSGKLAVGPSAVWIADPTTVGVRGVVHRVG